MFIKGYSLATATEMGCCGCFGFAFAKKQKKAMPKSHFGNHITHGLLQSTEVEYNEEEDEYEDNDNDDSFYGEDMSDTEKRDQEEFKNPSKRSQDILLYRTENGLICREFPVKKTHKVVWSEDENGNKLVNEYVREYKIGSGSYGKVVLYRSQVDGNHYAIKDFYNFMLNEDDDPNIATTNTLRQLGKKDYLWIMAANEPDLDTVINGSIRQKLKIIPANVS